MTAATGAAAGVPELESGLERVSRLAARLLGAPAAAVVVGDAAAGGRWVASAPGHPLLERLRAAGEAAAGVEPAVLSSPLGSEGSGSAVRLVVVDEAGRSWTAADREALTELSELAGSLLRSCEDADGSRYRALFDGSLDAVYVTSRDGRILHVNAAFEALFGYDADELEQRYAQELYVEPGDRERFHAAIAEKGAVQEFETRLRHRDGSVLECLLTSTARRAADGTVEYQGIIRDVTEQRRDRLMLEQTAAALRRSNAELEQFAYVASHDLQEPLRKIRAFGDRLRTKAADGLDEKASDYLRRMLNAAERMQVLIENLLGYSRVTSRGAEFEPVELGAVVEDVLGDLEPVIGAESAVVEVAPLPRVEADGLQMRQLFQNLLSNAIKYRREEEAPQVRVTSELVDRWGRPVRAGADGRAIAARIQVRDNGIGFEQEYADRIFELFQRLHGRDRYDGTGIGLGVCRKIVTRHGGTITAEGEPGRGATFTMTLPLRQEKE